jgi:uncharacterized protein
MNRYIEISSRLTESVDTRIVRNLYNQIDWSQRLIGVLGARGTGKTTLLLQYIKNNHKTPTQSLYLSLDLLTLQQSTLFDLADKFYKQGGQQLFIDEVHKYPHWSSEIKGIYDSYPGIQIIFSGSSAIQIHQSEADLSRRAAMYYLPNLSFREFIQFRTGLRFEPITLNEILENHIQHSRLVAAQLRPLQYFAEYLKYGAYPYYFEQPNMFHERLASTVKTIIESDLMAVSSFTYSSLIAMQKVLALIADSVPFKPNISELSRKSGLARDILLRMIDLLVRADLLMVLRQNSLPTGYMTKPEKLYLNNTSLAWALSLSKEPAIGTQRETFFMNQLKNHHVLTVAEPGDFLVDNRFTFEVGGASKTRKQIKGIPNSFIASDDIEIGSGNTIPLWLFGMMY